MRIERRRRRRRRRRRKRRKQIRIDKDEIGENKESLLVAQKKKKRANTITHY